MTNVTARELAAGRAVAIVFDRALVLAELRILQIDRAGRGECRPVACQSRRQHAIEHVYAAPDHFQQLRWSSQAHRVARLVVWQNGLARFDRTKHFLFRLADTDPADRVAVEIKIDQRLRALFAQFFKRRALDNSENQLSGFRFFCGGRRLGCLSRVRRRDACLHS